MRARVCLIGSTLVILVVVIAGGASATAAGAGPARTVGAAPAAGSDASAPPQRTAHDTDATSTDTNLLLNAGFETGSTDWTAVPSTGGQMTMVAETDTTAHDGYKYLEASSASAGASVEQSVPHSLSHDASASFSIWVRAAAGQSPSGQTANVCLWAGSPAVNACEPITLTSQWQQAEATVTVPTSGTSFLLAQVYLPTGLTMDLDGGVLSQNLLNNGGFEDGFAGWAAGNPPNGTATATVLTNPGAHDGSSYLQESATATSSSVYQDTAVSLSAGESMNASIWARLDPAATPTGQSINFCVFNMTASPITSSCTSLYLTHQWQQVSVTTTMLGTASTLRTQAFMYGQGAMDFDSATLVPDLLIDGGFDGAFNGWGQIPGQPGASMNEAVYQGNTARDGSSFYEMNSPVDNGSAYQDVAVNLPQGASATFSVWVRSAPGQSPAGQNVSICLWAYTNDTPACVNDTLTNDDWQEFEVTQTMPAAETTLRAQVYIPANLNIDLDGATLGAPQAAATVLPPVATGPPVISGSTTQGSTLSCSAGSWQGADAAPTGYSYSWERNATAIPGAAGPTYTTGQADVGDRISCAVGASNAAGQANASSASVGPITAPGSPSPAPTPAPTPMSTSPATTSPVPTTVTALKRLNLDDLSLVFSASAPKSCTAKTNTISVRLSTAARKATAKAKILTVGVYLGAGVKHRRTVIRTVHGKRRTVTVTTYTPNFTVKRLPATGRLDFTGRAATARALRAVVRYRLTTKLRGRTTTTTRQTTVSLTITPC